MGVRRCLAAAIKNSSPTRKFGALSFCILSSLIFTQLASAQSVITWGTPTAISGDTDVAAVSTRIWAYNFGDSAVSPTFNGVTFNGYASNTGNSDFTLTTVGSSIYQNTSAFGSTASFYTALSDGYEQLLKSATFWSGYLSHTQTMELKNLVPGASYLVQFWVNDSRPGSHAGLVVSFTDTFENTANVYYQHPGTSLGQFVTGTFVAASTTQTIGLGPYSPQINAATLGLTAIPEPSTATLAASSLILLAILIRRSFNQRR